MNDPDKRERQFVVRGKREYDYDTPSVRRRQTLREREEEEERLEKEERLSRTRGKRRPEREEYEEEEIPRRSRKAPPVEEDEVEDDYYEEEEHKAPKIVRIFAWIALMVILFACGYLATNYFFSWSDKRGGELIVNVFGKGSEV